MRSKHDDARGPRIAHVDGLRAIAVLLVIVHHMYPSIVVPLWSWKHLISEGAHGVDLFFVISGFCLSYPLLLKSASAEQTLFDVTNYFAKRFVRIVPPYYAALVLLPLSGILTANFGALDILKQSLFLDLQPHFINGSFWTLAIEFRWYFVFPLALILWRTSPKAFFTIAIATSVLYNTTIFHGVTDAGTLLPFMLGIVAADIEIRRRPLCQWSHALLPFGLLIAFIYEFYRPVDTPLFFQTNPGWQIIAFLLVVISSRGYLRKILSWKPLVGIGTASYSIYLIHQPIIDFIENHHPASPWLPVVSGTTAIAIGCIFWFVCERLWTSAPLKPHSVFWLNKWFARAAHVTGLPQSFSLRSIDA